jgi:hypothetical protein
MLESLRRCHPQASKQQGARISVLPTDRLPVFQLERRVGLDCSKGHFECFFFQMAHRYLTRKLLAQPKTFADNLLR